MTQVHVDIVLAQMGRVADADRAHDDAHRTTVIELHRDGRPPTVTAEAPKGTQAVQRGR